MDQIPSRIELFPEHPLFDRFLADPNKTLLTRPIDASWSYIGAVRRFQHGFNPFGGKLYVSHNSELFSAMTRKRMPEGRGSRRRLATESLFLVHDYLHLWSMMEADAFMRETLGKGLESLNSPHSADELALLLILSEVVATVGLDYWTLMEIEFGRWMDLSQMDFSLTITLSPDRIARIRERLPGFSVARESLFMEIAEFYLSGEMSGLDLGDVQASDPLREYAVHELQYGELQRAYARRWVSQIWQRIRMDENDSSPMQWRSQWQRDLAGHLGRRLWSLVKGDLPQPPHQLGFPLIGLPAIGSGEHRSMDPRLICIEKFESLGGPGFLQRFPDALEIVLANIELASLPGELQERLIDFCKKGDRELSAELIQEEFPGVLRGRRLEPRFAPESDDFVFSLP